MFKHLKHKHQCDDFAIRIPNKEMMTMLCRTQQVATITSVCTAQMSPSIHVYIKYLQYEKDCFEKLNMVWFLYYILFKDKPSIKSDMVHWTYSKYVKFKKTCEKNVLSNSLSLSIYINPQ